VTANSAELGTVNFTLILKRDGGKWKGDVKDSPTPLTITSVTIDDTNKITIAADAGGTAVTINGKFDNGEFAGDWSAGDIKGTWKGARKDDAAAAAKPAPPSAEVMAAMEGTYDAKISKRATPSCFLRPSRAIRFSCRANAREMRWAVNGPPADSQAPGRPRRNRSRAEEKSGQWAVGSGQ
jgi:hypothetical protein